MQLNFQKGYGHIIAPFDDETAKYLETIETGAAICFPKPKKIRDPRTHRKYFLMIGKSWEHISEKGLERWPVKYKWRKALEIAAGYYEENVLLIEDELIDVRQAKSISYEKLGEDEFKILKKAVYTQLTGYFSIWMNFTVYYFVN